LEAATAAAAGDARRALAVQDRRRDQIFCSASSPLYYQSYYGAAFSVSIGAVSVPTSWVIIGGTTLLEKVDSPDFSIVAPTGEFGGTVPAGFYTALLT
jgi:hypothetical protein